MIETTAPLPLLKRLEARARAANSLLCIGLDPHPELLTEYTAKAAYEFCARLIDQTHAMACAFKPNSAFFEALGGAGVDALRDVIAHIRQIDPTLLIILDAKRGDISSTAEAYARAAFEYLGADAITLNPYLGHDSIEPFLKYPGRGAFVLCRTSNPGAADFQNRMVKVDGHHMPLFRYVAETIRALNTENLGYVVGATDVDAIAHLRADTGLAWFLVPGVGAQGGELETAVWAGLRADGLGVLINASRSIARADDAREEAQRLRNAINAARTATGPGVTAADSTARQVAAALAYAECVRFGKFTLRSGIESPIYLDLRRLVSYPAQLRIVAERLAELIHPLQFDHLAGIPYAALPIAAITSQLSGRSLIYPRREAKEYGTKAQIEGVFKPGDTVALIDDLATTGESKFEAIEKLKAAGLLVRDVVVVIDREQGAKATLEAQGYRFHALITLTQLLDELQKTGRLSAAQRAEVDAFLAAQRKA